MTTTTPPFNPNEFNDHNNSESPFADELNRKLAQFRKMGRDFSALVNGLKFNVDRTNGEVKINLRPKSKPPIELAPLVRHLRIIHPLQAIIGWTSIQTPMLWSADLPKRHLLISGQPNAGKTGLLRSMILTLVLATRPAKLQLALVDGSCQRGNNYDHSELKRFSQLPHVLNRPPTSPAEVAEIIRFLSKEADHRQKHRVQTPQILLILDNLEDILPVAGPEFHQNLEHILDIGPQNGIVVILSTNRPEDGRLQDLISSIKVDRMVGKVHSAGQAAFATGMEDSDAEYLEGNGEFLAVINDNGYHFQAAWTEDRLLNRYINYLLEPKKPSLVAWDLFEESEHEETEEIIEDEIEPAEVAAPIKKKHSREEFKPRFLPPREPEKIYTQINPAWLTDDDIGEEDDAEESVFETFEDEFEDEELEEIEIIPREEEEHQLGWVTMRPYAKVEPEEEHQDEADSGIENQNGEEEPDEDWDSEEAAEEVEDVDLLDDLEKNSDVSAEEIDQQIRRSSLRTVKPRSKPTIRSNFRPVPKPSAAKQEESQNKLDQPDEDEILEVEDKSEPFDPWHSGLDEGDGKPDVVQKNGFERPPRLVKKKSVQQIRKINRRTN